MKFFYVVFGILVLVVYASADLRGREFRQTKKGFVPQGVRGAQSGARSFWYSGYRGGK
jgi:hypothetical protein